MEHSPQLLAFGFFGMERLCLAYVLVTMPDNARGASQGSEFGTSRTLVRLLRQKSRASPGRSYPSGNIRVR
jgi:hypothetical protein